MKRELPKETFARRLVRRFPEFQREYQDHLRGYGELVGHVLFGDTLNRALFELLETNRDRETIRRYIDFIEDMYANGDGDVRNIVEVTILERLGDEETVLRGAFACFSEALMLASQSIEKSWGRRDIRIWHKNGRTLYDWDWPPASL
ncbi:MAG: hypothetical protein HFF50_01125 [Lawsonibacter sp.]|nr:hypothetical protein [Lawsonibacter sp.]